MLGHTFYHGLIRKYVALFGTLFNDIYINRPDQEKNVTHTIKVPISYGPREKTLARALGDPDLNKMPAIQLPRMSFELLDLSYASSRKLNTLGKRYKVDSGSPDELKYQYNPVPYDFRFTLSIMVKNADDGTRIVEQILPYFTPEWTTTVHLVPEMGIVMDIPVVLSDVSVSDDYESNFETRRAIIWTLTFTLKGYLFGPVRRGSVIKFTETNIFNSLAANTQLQAVNVQPGLTANGQPTTDANSSISVESIDAEDNFGYVVSITEP
jgi:hypothetical protein